MVSAEPPDWTGYVFRILFRLGELSTLTIARDDTAIPLGAGLLQRVPLGAIERCARDWVTETAEIARRDDPALGATFARPVEVESGLSMSRQLRLAEVAKAYVDTISDRNQRASLAVKCHASQDHVPNLVREARDAGLLLPARPGHGRRVGYLSNKARELLGEPPLTTWWEQASEGERAWLRERQMRQEAAALARARGEITPDEYHRIFNEERPESEA